MAQKLLIAVLTFITIPVFIRLLGPELFGVFAIVGTIGDLSRLTNVGFHIALIKFLSFQGRTKESSQDIVVAFSSMLLIMGLLVVALLAGGDYIILQIFNVSPEFFHESRQLYNFLVFANALLFLGMPFSAVLESQKLIYKVNYFQLLYGFLYWGLILIFVSAGGGLGMIGLGVFIAALIWFLFTVVSAARAWGPFELKGMGSYYLQSVRKQLGYGLKVYLSGLLGLFVEPLAKVMVANFFGVAFVGFLDIGLRVRNQLVRILKSGIWPLFQYFSENPEKRKAGLLVNDIQEKLIMGFIPVSVILLFAARPLVYFWIGENVDVITNSLLVVTLGALMGQLVLEPINIYLGVHYPLRLFYNQIFMIIAMATPIFLLREVLGYASVYLGFALAYLVSFVHMLLSQRFILGSLVFQKGKCFYRLLVYLVSLVGLGFVVSEIIYSNLLTLLLIPLLIPVFAWVLIRNLRLVKKSDVFFYFGQNNGFSKALAWFFPD